MERTSANTDMVLYSARFVSAASVQEVLREMKEVCLEKDQIPFLQLWEYLSLKVSGMRDLLNLQHQEAQFVALFADPQTIDPEITERLQDLMYDCPAAPRMPLEQQGNIMMETTKKWLYDLGRNPAYGQKKPLGGWDQLFAPLELGWKMPAPKADQDRFVLGATSRPSKWHCTDECMCNSPCMERTWRNFVGAPVTLCVC